MKVIQGKHNCTVEIKNKYFSKSPHKQQKTFNSIFHLGELPKSLSAVKIEL